MWQWECVLLRDYSVFYDLGKSLGCHSWQLGLSKDYLMAPVSCTFCSCCATSWWTARGIRQGSTHLGASLPVWISISSRLFSPLSKSFKLNEAYSDYWESQRVYGSASHLINWVFLLIQSIFPYDPSSMQHWVQLYLAWLYIGFWATLVSHLNFCSNTNCSISSDMAGSYRITYAIPPASAYLLAASLQIILIFH